MLYIYMSEDNMYSLIEGLDQAPSTPVIFKAGFSKHPLLRGGQLKQAARRSIGQEVNMRVCNYYAPCNTDNRKEAEYIERYILSMIARRLSAVKLPPEFFFISIEDRAYCYKHLRLWIGTARQRMRKEGALMPLSIGGNYEKNTYSKQVYAVGGISGALLWA